MKRMKLLKEVPWTKMTLVVLSFCVVENARHQQYGITEPRTETVWGNEVPIGLFVSFGLSCLLSTAKKANN